MVHSLALKTWSSVLSSVASLIHNISMVVETKSVIRSGASAGISGQIPHEGCLSQDTFSGRIILLLRCR